MYSFFRGLRLKRAYAIKAATKVTPKTSTSLDEIASRWFCSKSCSGGLIPSSLVNARVKASVSLSSWPAFTRNTHVGMSIVAMPRMMAVAM